MNWKICKKFSFDAAHKLNGLPPGHKCGNLHGHTYTVEVEFSSEDLDEYGFVVDFGDLAPIKQLIDGAFDHRCLNDVVPEGYNPTAENLASMIYACVTMIFETRRLLASGQDPMDVEINLPRFPKFLVHRVVPLRENVEITAVRVSETGSSWAECAN